MQSYQHIFLIYVKEQQLLPVLGVVGSLRGASSSAFFLFGGSFGRCLAVNGVVDKGDSRGLITGGSPCVGETCDPIACIVT